MAETSLQLSRSRKKIAFAEKGQKRWMWSFMKGLNLSWSKMKLAIDLCTTLMELVS